MGKPEIIGYQADPLNWSAPTLPDIAIDSDGLWVERPGSRRYIPPEDVDALYRSHGWKRVYKPREFHARAVDNGGYLMHCKTCGADFAAGDMLPHDVAKLHAETNHHHSVYWS